jgi:hypothetical protein
MSEHMAVRQKRRTCARLRIPSHPLGAHRIQKSAFHELNHPSTRAMLTAESQGQPLCERPLMCKMLGPNGPGRCPDPSRNATTSGPILRQLQRMSSRRRLRAASPRKGSDATKAVRTCTGLAIRMFEVWQENLHSPALGRSVPERYCAWAITSSEVAPDSAPTKWSIHTSSLARSSELSLVRCWCDISMFHSAKKGT